MFALARVGSASLRATLVAVPMPSLLTEIVNPTGLPASTVAASGVLTTEMCGLLVTQTPVWAVELAALELTTWTRLLRFVAYVVAVSTQPAMVLPGAGAVVWLVTW